MAFTAFSFSLSTGLTKSGWALSVLGAKRWGDGYIREPTSKATTGSSTSRSASMTATSCR
ncbi:MAG: hypothetical protein ACLUQ6_01100 [Alistipes onderdonkii]